MKTTVTIEQGTLQGAQEHSTLRFLGIPYAAPPVGDLRWRAPSAPPSWAGTRDATRFGPCAMQTIGASFDLRVAERSEDCLYLNVWTSSLEKNRRAPVMVWIHGGGHLGGAGSEDAFDGASFASQGVTLITFNYRLGAFGFLAHPELGANFAVQDWIAALRWVQRNVVHFGGDPDNVTIFGESAGAVAARILMCSPSAAGLFHKAVLESAGFERPAFARDWTFEQARRHAERFFEKLGTSDPAKLRQLPSGIVGQASHELCGLPPPRGQIHTPANLVWVPFADGDIVLEEAVVAQRARIPVLMGVTRNEARYFIKPTGTYQEALLKKMIEVLCGSVASKVGEILSESSKPLYDLLDEVFTRVVWTEPAIETAHRLNNLGLPVYYYTFARVSPGAGRTNELAMHTSEIRYVFGNLTDGDYYNEVDHKLSRQLQAAWIAFATHGVPRLSDGYRFPQFDPAAPRQTWIGDEMENRALEAGDLIAALNSMRTNGSLSSSR